MTTPTSTEQTLLEACREALAEMDANRAIITEYSFDTCDYFRAMGSLRRAIALVTDDDGTCGHQGEDDCYGLCSYWDEQDAEQTLDEPNEDDLVTEDHQHWYQYGKLVLTTEIETCEAELRVFMDQQRFWPSVFFISDHGNAISMSATVYPAAS